MCLAKILSILRIWAKDTQLMFDQQLVIGTCAVVNQLICINQKLVDSQLTVDSNVDQVSTEVMMMMMIINFISHFKLK